MRLLRCAALGLEGPAMAAVEYDVEATEPVRPVGSSADRGRRRAREGTLSFGLL